MNIIQAYEAASNTGVELISPVGAKVYLDMAGNGEKILFYHNSNTPVYVSDDNLDGWEVVEKDGEWEERSIKLKEIAESAHNKDAAYIAEVLSLVCKEFADAEEV